jgi:hypothetical protein
MQVFKQNDPGLTAAACLNHPLHDGEKLSLARVRVDSRSGVLRIGHTEKLERRGQRILQGLVQYQ